MIGQKPRGLHGQTVEILATRILADEWGEGAVLDLPTLREELDISLTALREALKVLAAKGMIGAKQKRGTYVQPRAQWNMLDADMMRWQTASNMDNTGLLDQLTEVRAVVEPAAARIAATRATEEDLAALAEALRQMADAADVEASVRADLEFHRLLMTATHNNFLVQMEQVIAIGLAERDRIVHGASPADDPVPSHREVLDAVVAGDPEAAERAMHALITKADKDLKRASRSLPRNRGK